MRWRFSRETLSPNKYTCSGYEFPMGKVRMRNKVRTRSHENDVSIPDGKGSLQGLCFQYILRIRSCQVFSGAADRYVWKSRKRLIVSERLWVRFFALTQNESQKHFAVFTKIDFDKQKRTARNRSFFHIYYQINNICRSFWENLRNWIQK